MNNIEELNVRVVHCKGDKNHYYVGRPNVLGNPFTHKENTKAEFIVATRDIAVAEYKKYILDKIKNNDKEVLAELRRLKNHYLMNGELLLGCWCYPASCHGDVLKEILIKSLTKTIQLREINSQKYFFIYDFDIMTEKEDELIFDSNETVQEKELKTNYKDVFQNQINNNDLLEIVLKNGEKKIGKIIYLEDKKMFVIKIDNNYYPIDKLPLDKVIKINGTEKKNTLLKDIENKPVFLYDEVELLLPSKTNEVIKAIVIETDGDYKLKTKNHILPITDYLFLNKSSWLKNI